MNSIVNKEVIVSILLYSFNARFNFSSEIRFYCDVVLYNPRRKPLSNRKTPSRKWHLQFYFAAIISEQKSCEHNLKLKYTRLYIFESRIPNIENWNVLSNPESRISNFGIYFRIPNPEYRILECTFESRIPNVECNQNTAVFESRISNMKTQDFKMFGICLES